MIYHQHTHNKTKQNKTLVGVFVGAGVGAGVGFDETMPLLPAVFSIMALSSMAMATSCVPVQSQKLMAADFETEAWFGKAAVYADRLVIGVPGDNEGTTNVGAAYIFTRAANNTWGQEPKLSPSVTSRGFLRTMSYIRSTSFN